MTAIDVTDSKKKLKEIAQMRKRMNWKISLIKRRLKEMRDSFEVKKKLIKTIKDGVTDIVLWIKHVEVYHQK